LAFEPRGSLLVGPFADLTFMASLGRGVRAADPAYLGDGDQAPFSSITAAEGGVVWDRDLGGLSLNLRGVYYYTRVGQDLIFNQQEGRNTLAPGTRRQGVLFAGRARSPWFDVSASATYAHARFESTSTPADPNYVPADAGERVPFIPDWVVRADAAFFHEFTQWQLLGHALRGRAGFGLSYVSPRALLFGEQGETLFLVDASAAVGVGAFELGVSIMNLFDVQYREAEFNYASEFRPDPVAPNLLPVRHFTAGAPRTLMFTLTVHLDGGKEAS
jgi:hypothetical protein